MNSTKKDNVPTKLNGSVGAFCREISKEKPIYIEFSDAKYGYEATHCYDNVKHYIENHGGEAVYGWIIWKDTDFPLSAEHHAVWKSPSGKLYDITPRVDGEEKIVFLADPARPYDFKHTWCNRHNGDSSKPFWMNGAKTRDEKIEYRGYHPYHRWIGELPGNPDNSLE